MKCSDIRELFSPYIDGEIDPEEKKLLEEHIARCPDCAEELSQWRKMSALLGEVGSIEINPPVELRKNVMAQINGTGKAGAAKPKGKIASVFSMSRCKGLVAAAASILIFGCGYLGLSGGSEGITNPSAQIAKQGSGEVQSPADSERDKDSAGDRNKDSDAVGSTEKPSAHESNSQDNSVPGKDNSSEPGTDKPANVGNESVDTPDTKQDEGVPGQDQPVMLLSVEKICCTASIQLEAPEQEAAVVTVKGLADQYQAECSQQPLEQAMLIQLKVSNEHFSQLVTNLQKLGEVKDKKIQEKDMTAQYKQISYEIQDLEEQKNAVKNDPAAVNRLTTEIEALKVNLAHIDQQVENAFIAIWIE